MTSGSTSQDTHLRNTRDMTRTSSVARRFGVVLAGTVALVVHLAGPATSARPGVAESSPLTVETPTAQQSFGAGETPTVSGWVEVPPGRFGAIDVILTNLDTLATYSPDGLESRIDQRITVPTSDDGRWSWEPTFSLRAGAYSVRVSAPALMTDAISVPFSVSADSGSSFVSFLLGRAQAALDMDDAICDQPALVTPDGNRLTLGELAVRSRAVRPDATFTGTVITSTAGAARDPCSTAARWEDLAELRDSYGWSFISQGKEYVNVPSTTVAYPFGTARSAYDNVCGSLEELTARGHDRAWGMFAYPDGNGDDHLARFTTTECFAFGRIYSPGINTRGSFAPSRGLVSPDLRYVRVTSVLGGACADVSLPCAHIEVRNDRRYTSPELLSELVDVGPGQWAVVQVYVLAEGARSVPADDPTADLQWDCRGDGPDHWDRHWTSRPELYCWNDLADVIRSISPDTIVTDPAGVAEAWDVAPDRSPGAVACGPLDRCLAGRIGPGGADLATAVLPSPARVALGLAVRAAGDGPR